MKKFYKILTAVLAAAIIMASPVGTLTARAEGAGFEAGNEGKGAGTGNAPGTAADAMAGYTPSISDEQPAPAPAQPAPAQPTPAPAPAPAQPAQSAPAVSNPAPAQTVTESAPAQSTTQNAPAKKTEKVAEVTEEAVETVVNEEELLRDCNKMLDLLKPRKMVEGKPAFYRNCSCGYTHAFYDEDSKMSALQNAAWKLHVALHKFRGVAVSYTDVYDN